MTTPDKILFAQTLIALFTGAVVVWYTIVTHKLQRHAREQNIIQKEHLELAKQELSRKRESERRLSMPYIRWRGGSSSLQDYKWEFENVGADIYEVRWTVSEGVQFDHYPKRLLRSLEQGWVHLSGQKAPMHFPCRFSITFATRIGEIWTKTFEMTQSGEQPKEIEEKLA